MDREGRQISTSKGALGIFFAFVIEMIAPHTQTKEEASRRGPWVSFELVVLIDRMKHAPNRSYVYR